MEAALVMVRAAVEQAGLPLRVLAGGELDLVALDGLGVPELRRFALGGSHALLVETPYYGWPLDVADRLFRLQTQGFRPVLAHPERNREVQEAPERLRPLVERGVLVQVTAASLDGRLGRTARATGSLLLAHGLAHLLASDAHAPELREVGMAAAVRGLRDDALGEWLVRAVPAALLADAAVPPRPAARRRRRLPWS
jgi:protein-tyrosine phosphatase